MDNTHLANPSPEWLAFDAAHPERNINGIDTCEPSPATNPAAFRDAANAAKVASVRSLMVGTGLDSRVARRDFFVPARDGHMIPLRAYRFAGGGSSPSSSSSRPGLGADTETERKGEPESGSTTGKGAGKSQLPAAFVYLHGGGMLIGTQDTEDHICSIAAELLREDDVVVLSVCYRHTPEFVFPVQHHDAADAVAWILRRKNAEGVLGVDCERVVVGGLSSGGGLAVWAALEVSQGVRSLRREGEGIMRGGGGDVGRIKGLALGMPWLVHRDAYPFGEWYSSSSDGGERKEKSSLVQCRGAPIMPGERYDLFTDLLRVRGREDAQRFSVGLRDEEELRRLMPPTALLVCGWDMLRDEGIAFGEKLDRAG